MKTTKTIPALLAVAALALAGCSGADSGKAEEAEAPEQTATEETEAAEAPGCEGANVAYITPAMSVPFWRSLSAGVKRGAEDAGMKVTDYDSDLSASTQLQNAQDAITSGVDAIIISPTDSASAPAVLDVAADAGVPVFIADIGTDSGDFVTFVKTDNVGGAAAAGEYLVEVLNEQGITSGNIGMVGISQSRQNGKDRTQGFTEVVEGAGFKVLELLESEDYTRSEGLTLAQDLITANPDMVAIFTQHDEATLGALTAIETAGLTGKLLIVGFDGSTDTFEAIESGVLAGASMQQPVLMGEEAAKAVCAYLNGDTPEETVFVDTIMVTDKNVETLRDEVADKVFAEK